MPDLSFIDLRTFYTILHLVGVAIGAGGAFASDYVFFQSVRDNKISKDEARFIKNSSKMVWLGLFILSISGLGLYLLNTAWFIDSSKFISKMTIVFIIALNGILFHFLHIPKITSVVGNKLSKNKEFLKNKKVLLASGAVSFVSWITAIILGALRGIPYSVEQILSTYFIIVLVAIIFSQILGKYIIPSN